jgi:extracellular factor (EF) 3-hydroxypalmitic acid methyl ester biosynthesis protein
MTIANPNATGINKVKAQIATMPYQELIRLSDQFDQVCREGSSRHGSEQYLRELDDQLWFLSQSICAEIDLQVVDGISEFRKEHFERKVLKWLRSNSAINNLWTKPAGYSGDYQTIELICQDRRSWSRFEDIFLNHLLRSEMAYQHRQKVAAQAKFVADLFEANRPIKLLNAGCGPCFDIRLAIEKHEPERESEFVLVDLDPEAISFSQRQLSRFSDRVKFTFLNRDILRAVKRLCGSIQEVGTYDAVLFGGLFDYLPDRYIILLLGLAKQLLKPDGEIFFSQVSTDNPNRTYMKWYGDWELLERDEDALLQLCEEANLHRDTVVFTREQSGVAILGRVRDRKTL